MDFDEYFSVDNVVSVFKDKLRDSRAIGIDGTSMKEFERVLGNQVEIIVRKCHEGTYRFTRFKEKLISKGAHSKPRQISIPTIRDALVLRILCNLLMEKFPKCRLKPPHLHIKDIRNALALKVGDTFLRLDVKEFYPSIDREILREKLEFGEVPIIAIDLIMVAITNKTGSKNSLPMDCGIPQGLSISNILASIYFSKIDEQLKKMGGYSRYVDDILLICNETECDTLYEEIKKLLHFELNLSVHEPNISTDKSVKRSIRDGVDYLGFHITDQSLKVRKKSYEKIFNAIVRLFTLYTRNPRSYKKKLFLWRLNLIITGCRFGGKSVGWMFFFRLTEDMEQIHKLDALVKKMIREKDLSKYHAKVKTFIKTYREIRYNNNQTTYMPDFDNFTQERKIKKIVMITGKDPKKLQNLASGKINKKFQDIMRREVRRMEQETIDFADGYH